MSSPQLRGSRAWWTRGRVVAVTLMASLALNAGFITFAPRSSAQNPPPTTAVLIPSHGATLAGSTYLDASASNATSVGFVLFGGSYGYSGQLLCTATPTLYGWLCAWNTATVPNGTYILLSGAINSAGVAFSSGVSVTVDNLPLYTQVLVPSAGTTVGGNVVLDASAEGTAPITGVKFTATQGSTVDTVGTATPTPYGWVRSGPRARVLATHLCRTIRTERGRSKAWRPRSEAPRRPAHRYRSPS